MTPVFKPMLASELKDKESFTSYPVYISPKLDGIRATIQGGRVMSRSLKLIANQWIQKTLGNPALNGLDGELICGDPTVPECFNVTTTQVGTASGIPKNLIYWVFDVFGPEPFNVRWERALQLIAKAQKMGLPVQAVPQSLIYNLEQLIKAEEMLVNLKFEGAMIRTVKSPYKQGRSTLNEGYLLKLKRFKDEEAEIVGFKEEFENTNPATINELGKTSRSSHKAGKVPKNTLASFICKSPNWPTEFAVGSGCLTEIECKKIWENRENLIGKTITFKYQECGVKDKPRFAGFRAFRADWDRS